MTKISFTIELQESEEITMSNLLMSLPVEDRTYESAIRKLLTIYEKLIQDIQNNFRKANRLEPIVRSFVSHNTAKNDFDDLMGCILIDLNRLFEDLNRDVKN